MGRAGRLPVQTHPAFLRKKTMSAVSSDNLLRYNIRTQFSHWDGRPYMHWQVPFSFRLPDHLQKIQTLTLPLLQKRKPLRPLLPNCFPVYCRCYSRCPYRCYLPVFFRILPAWKALRQPSIKRLKFSFSPYYILHFSSLPLLCIVL